MKDILVKALEPCDIISPELKAKGYRFGKKALFPGQFYEIPGDSMGVKVTGTGEAVKYSKVPLNQVPVREVSHAEVAEEIIEGRKAKAERTKRGATPDGWMKEALEIADKKQPVAAGKDG